MSPRTSKPHVARAKCKPKKSIRQALDESRGALDRLRTQMDASSQSKRRADRVFDEIADRTATLKMLRTVNDLTQVDVADAAGMNQAEISRIEQRSDILLSTLRKIVEATGGQLQLVARYPGAGAITLVVDD